MSYSVLLVASVPPPVAGQSVATEMLLRQLSQRDMDFSVVNISRPFYDQSIRWPLVSRATHALGFPIQAIARARGLRGRPIVFYLQLGQSARAMMRDLPLLALAHSMKWPVVLHIHGAGFRMAFDQLPRVMASAVAAAIARAARVIVLSPSLRRLVAGLIPDDRVVVVENGVPGDVAERGAARTREALHRPCRVLYLSNLIDTKGYVNVLEAAALAQQRNLPIEFVLAGAVTEHTTVHPDAFIADHALRNTRFVGPVGGDDKLDQLEHSDVFVLPTYYPVEGQPISILEALHFGLPVVTCAAGGIPDVIQHERNGLLVPARDPAALVEGFERLLGDPPLYAEMCRNNRELAAAYSEPGHGKRMVAVFDDVARSC